MSIEVNEVVPDEKQKLIARLVKWANMRNVMDDPYLLNLINDIEENRNISFWHTQDPLELMPEVENTEGSNFIKWSRIISTIRNTLVFLPVAITWKAVSLATAGFAEFVSTNNATPVNFLEFWQNGYGYLSKFWTIGAVAEIDFLIILLVIFASLLSNILLANGSKANSFMAELLEKERISLAMNIKKFLFDTKPSSVTTINSDVLIAVERLTNGIGELNKATDNISKLSYTLMIAVPEVQSLQRSINEITINNTNELDAKLKDFNLTSDSIFTNLSKSLSTLEVNIGSVSKSIDESLKMSVANMSSDIQHSNSSIKKNARQLEKELRDLAQEINRSLRILQTEK